MVEIHRDVLFREGSYGDRINNNASAVEDDWEPLEDENDDAEANVDSDEDDEPTEEEPDQNDRLESNNEETDDSQDEYENGNENSDTPNRSRPQRNRQPRQFYGEMIPSDWVRLTTSPNPNRLTKPLRVRSPRHGRKRLTKS